MALCFRIRRALTLSSSIVNRKILCSAIPATSASPSISSVTLNPENPERDLTPSPPFPLSFQSRLFRSSTISLAPPRPPYNNNSNEEIGPDTILFEGCDYNHWLITMEFPKDPKPTPEEMVETYVQTLAKVVGSVEEAKKRMYACSTTTYTGFQAEMSEETSEKFKGLPGVVFVLPDSYIDPINKEYGGDKYINGTIIPRPPPIQYGQRRYADRNRDRQNRSRGLPPYQQGNSAYNQGSMQGDTRNYGEQQYSSPQQNFGPAGPGERRAPMPMNNTPGGRDIYQGERRDPMPMNNTPGGRDTYQGERRDPIPMNNTPGGRDTYQGERRDPMPMNNSPGGRDTYQGDRRDPMPSYQTSYNQGERGNYYAQGRRDFPPGDGRNQSSPEQRNFQDNRNYAYPQGGNYGQGTGGTYGQGTGVPYGQGAGGPYGQGVADAHGREMGAGYGQSYPGHGGDQRFAQVEERSSTQREQRNYPPMSNTGTDQGRY